MPRVADRDASVSVPNYQSHLLLTIGSGNPYTDIDSSLTNENLSESRCQLVHKVRGHPVTWKGVVSRKYGPAIAILEKDDLETARAHLKATPSKQPFFEQYRQQLLVTLLETTPKKPSGRLGSLMRKVNQYVSLKPNVFGIGLDLNKIVEDISAGPDRHADSPDSHSSDTTKA